MGMKILVTGHSGLLGNALLKKLRLLKFEVYGVSRTDRHHVEKNVFLTDLQDHERVKYVFDQVQPDIVYHLAANASESMGQVSPRDMVQRNVGMFTNVLSEAISHKVKKFIFASSISVYGDAKTPYEEKSFPLPKDVYGVNKFACEMILKIMANVYGFEYTILRPHNIYGPGQNMNDLSKNVVALFMRKIITGEPYILYGEGKMIRAFSYVDDVADVFAEAARKFKNITMNVGSTEVHTIKELSDMIQKIAHGSNMISSKPIRPQEMADFIAEHELQHSLVSYKDTPLEKGIQTTWEWVKKQRMLDLPQVPKEIYV